ncbi:hypothetical protein Dsin_019296 [Dipteronia sinensis]|uniref:RNase H type-1 domain-containing protein n=1 Tax=Dipteronia sinensis TaxID=43782 RepID=A0AAE0A796_9ROSI|nr:hypothetical protein Dsin_019296 [Dipteronia sinensis]
MCVSSGMSRVRVANLARIIRVQLVISHERYLGLPNFAGRNKKAIFANIRDHVWDRIKGLIPLNLGGSLYSALRCHRRRAKSSTHALWCYPSLKKIRAMCPFMKNLKVHESLAMNDEIVPWNVSFLDDYRRANMKELDSVGRTTKVILAWHPPPTGQFKVNTDASTDVNGGKVGIGIIFQDDQGKVMESNAHKIMAGYSTQIDEAEVLLRGLRFVREVGMWLCVLETDARVEVNLINAKSVPCFEIGLIMSDIFILLANSPNFSVGFTPRKVNMDAHSLAKLGLNIVDDFFG